MLTLRKTHSTFVALNHQCRGNLGRSPQHDSTFLRYSGYLHLRTIETSISLGTGQRTSLNCSKDAGILVSIPSIAYTLISSVLWASPLKTVPFPDEGHMLSLLVKGKFYTRGGATSSSLSTDRKRMTDGRLNEFLSKNLIISSKWGIFRGKLLSPSLNFIPSGSR